MIVCFHCSAVLLNKQMEWPSGLEVSTLPGQATSGICFSVVASSNPRSRFVNSQLVCFRPVGIFNYVTFILKYQFPLFQWHACKLPNLSACIAKCMTTIKKIYTFSKFLVQKGYIKKDLLHKYFGIIYRQY